MPGSRFLWLTAICGLLCGGCQPVASESGASTATSVEAERPKVTTVQPTRRTVIRKTVQPGRIEAYRMTPIHAKVAGFADQVKVDIGDRVKGPQRAADGTVSGEGQILVVLSAPELTEEFRQKQAIVEQVKAEILQADASVRVAVSMQTSARAGVEECVAGEQRMEAEFEKAKSEWDRIRELAEAKAVTEKLAEEAQLQLRSAEAGRTEARARRRSAEAALNEAGVAVEKAKADLLAVEATVKVAEAERDRISALRDYLTIRAPFDGVITERHIDDGHLVQPSRGSQDQPLFVLMQAETVRIFIDVPEADAALVETGREAKITVSALGNSAFSGSVARTGWALQAGTRSLRCEIDVPNPDGRLRPGMYAQAELTVAERADVLAVPVAAIVSRDGQAWCVSVTADNTILRKQVEVGIRSATDAEIISGLEGTEQILSANAAAFTDGQNVERMSP